MRLVWLFPALSLWVGFLQISHAAELSTLNHTEYLNSLIELGKDKGLAKKRAWQVLLHYRKNLLDSRATSEIDSPEFFLAKTGKTDPELELEATLTAFFSTKQITTEKQLSQCAYPARYQWLDSQLKFDPVLMQVQQCETLELWRQRIDPESVSLIFSSYFINNPASMFGHTLLRINRKDSEKTSLLDFSINYAAVSLEEDNPFTYAWKGLTGGYQGRFSITPYYDMVKQYNDTDNRDLWEYRLNLSPVQIELLLLHFWELGRTHFNYYFFRENCSYHLLSMLEVADPGLYLRDSYWAWTLPTETIKQVANIPGLVESVTRRPSLSSQLNRSFKLMTDEERKYLKWLVDNDELTPPDFKALSPGRQAMVTDTAINFLQYQNDKGGKDADQRKNKIYALLLQRSQLPASDEPVSTVPELVSPDKGHDLVRFEISGGKFRPDEGVANRDRESMTEFSIQPGFHNLLSPEDGHAPDSQVKFLELRMRYESGRGKWQLQNFNLVDIISLYPVSALIQEASWKINLGWERNQDGACADCTAFVMNSGVGLTLQSNLHRREVYFAFLEADLEFDHDFESGHRAGFGASVGFLFEATKKWRMALIAKRTRFTKGQGGYVSEAELSQRYYLSRNTEVVLDFKAKEKYREGRLGIAFYF